MRVIAAEPLTASNFAPFGQLINAPVGFGRDYFSAALASGRSAAKPSLSLAHIPQLAGTRLETVKMERHEFSSQSFVPIDVSRYLVIVAPHAADGQPDPSLLKAFVAREGQGITFGMNVWHHPMTVLDRPGRFAVFMWLEGGPGDEEFAALPEPVGIAFPMLSQR